MCVSKRQGTCHTHDAVTDEAQEEDLYNSRHFCFPPFESPSFTTITISSRSTRANALQYVDAILTLLHSFIKHGRGCAHTKLMLAQYQAAVVKISCLAMLGN